MLNKNRSFWGRLFVSSAIAVYTYVSSGVIAKESLHDLRSELNQIYWNALCSNREVLISNSQDYAEYKWILKDKYEESRAKVIGKAIGDCVAEKNEFAGKSSNDIIIFDEKKYPDRYISPERYEPQHWNAVILYNYVHEAINGECPHKDEQRFANNRYDVEVLLNKTGKLEAIRQHYGKYYNQDTDRTAQLSERLKNAEKDIQQYVKALDLNNELYDFRWKQEL